MTRDITFAKELGADGIVFGVRLRGMMPHCQLLLKAFC
jgi:copper homeostasis protein CutC